MIDKETKEARPVTQFLNGEQFANDVKKINDASPQQVLVLGRHGARHHAQLRSLRSRRRISS